MTLIDSVLNVPLRLAIAMLSGRFLRSETRPEHLIDLAYGNESLRVLVVGAGLAAGYGARTQSRALPGQLAMALSSRSGRGVVVQTRASRSCRSATRSSCSSRRAAAATTSSSSRPASPR